MTCQVQEMSRSGGRFCASLDTQLGSRQLGVDCGTTPVVPLSNMCSSPQLPRNGRLQAKCACVRWDAADTIVGRDDGGRM